MTVDGTGIAASQSKSDDKGWGEKVVGVAVKVALSERLSVLQEVRYNRLRCEGSQCKRPWSKSGSWRRVGITPDDPLAIELSKLARAEKPRSAERSGGRPPLYTTNIPREAME